jgi:ectoine hydroxylase-related dioxygenase (phytanoyl-CoA dioxygenase family)
MKPPGGVEKPYHQDSPYFPIEPMSLVTCWIALDNVTIENGCLWVVPGSHRLGPLPHSERWMVGDREDMRVPETEFNRNEEVPITLTPGSCSFHHSLILHMSHPNKTQTARRGLAFHYMTSKSRWTNANKSQPNYLLLRGQEYPGCV